MKRKRVILLWLLLLSSVAACSPGHLGSNEIAFLRNGQLWTIDPDGANAFAVVADAPEVVSYMEGHLFRLFFPAPMYVSVPHGGAQRETGSSIEKHLLPQPLFPLLYRHFGGFRKTISQGVLHGNCCLARFLFLPSIQIV